MVDHDLLRQQLLFVNCKWLADTELRAMAVNDNICFR